MNSHLLLLFGLGGAVYLTGLVIYRLYLSPLAKFPGPKRAAISLWYEFYWDCTKKGQYMWKIREMHEKYGPIVRINPYELHIIDPDFYDELYSGKKNKYEWWTKVAGADQNAFATVSYDLHRMRRAPLSPLFSARAVSALEPTIRSKVDKLVTRFDQFARTDEIVRLDTAFMALTMDIICDYSFGKDRKYLDEPDFKEAWKNAVLGAFENGAMVRMYPWIVPVMKSLPISVVSWMNEGAGQLMWWQQSVREDIQPILDGTDEKTKDTTIFHALRDSNLPPEERALERLVDEAEAFTGAGSETTAQTLTRLMFYLKREPQTLQKLREELDPVFAGASKPLSWNELQKLPYMTAVIKEGLRLSYGVTTRLPRISNEDMIYKDHVIPAGTPVSQAPYHVLVHPDIFPEPEVFRPERWLETPGLDKYLVSFGRGTRSCIGINLAYAELYITMSTLATHFNWELYDTSLKDVVCKHDFFVAVADRSSKGLVCESTVLVFENSLYWYFVQEDTYSFSRRISGGVYEKLFSSKGGWARNLTTLVDLAGLEALDRGVVRDGLVQCEKVHEAISARYK